MNRLIGILRLIALSILFGGSTAVVFVAITLVKSATANGVPVSEAAANNAPAFIGFASVAIATAVVLLICEGLDCFALRGGLKGTSKLVISRYVCSTLCAIATAVFAFAIVPPMKELLPMIKTDEAKAQEFRRLHEVSRAVFGGTIIFALLALVMEGLEAEGTKRTGS